MRSCLSFRRCLGVRILCKRSDSLTKITRMSPDMAMSILRWFSDNCSSWDLYLTLPSLVTPSTITRTSDQTPLSKSSKVASVSSTTSCKKPQATVTASNLSLAKIPATLDGVNDIRLTWFYDIDHYGIQRRKPRPYGQSHIPLPINISVLKRQLHRLLNSLSFGISTLQFFLPFYHFLRIWKLEKEDSELFNLLERMIE